MPGFDHLGSLQHLSVMDRLHPQKQPFGIDSEREFRAPTRCQKVYWLEMLPVGATETVPLVLFPDSVL